MIFLSGGIFLLSLTVLPWWSVWLSALVLGAVTTSRSKRRHLQVAIAATIVTMAMAFVLDGAQHGLVTKRLSPLFGLSSVYGIYLGMGLLGFVSALLGYHLGQSFTPYVPLVQRRARRLFDALTSSV